MSKTVIGVFETTEDAHRARAELEQSGLPYDRAMAHTGEEFVLRMQSSGAPQKGENLRAAFQQFLAELGGSAPDASRPIAPDEGVLMVVTPDERADAIARFIDEHGAVDIDERQGRLTDRGKERGATGHETSVAGRTPPDMPTGEPGWIGSGESEGRKEPPHGERRAPRCARIYNC